MTKSKHTHLVVPVLTPHHLQTDDSPPESIGEVPTPARNPDYILVWNSKDKDSTNQHALQRRSVFEYNLEEEGLILGWEKCKRSPELYYVKIWATIEVLKRYSEILKIKLPMKEFKTESGDTGGDSRHSMGSSISSLRKSSQWFHECWGNMGNCCKLESSVKRCRQLTGVFSRDREYLFDLDESSMDVVFPIAIRARIIHYILNRTPYKSEEELKNDAFAFGIQRLIQHDVYETSFPLHDGAVNTEGCVRKLLNDNWGKFSAICKFQPLDTIKDYFGVNIGLYFAWLGFYTRMLLCAAFFGFICFIYGALTLSSDQFVKDVCTMNITMCPLCDLTCGYWNLTEKCQFAKVAYLFDNEFSFVFALFMSVWAAIFLELWKRHTAKITHHWDLSTFDQKKDFNPRPEYVAELKKIYPHGSNRHTGKNEETGEEKTKTFDFELSIPFWSKQLPFGIFSYSTVILLVIMAFAAVIGVIIYRLWFSDYLFTHVDENNFEFGWHKLVISVTAALLNLTFILIFGRLYKILAGYLTHLEYPRTQIEYDSSYTLKIYLLEFINNYSSIFYVAFFKGSYVGAPNDYHKVFGRLRQEECGLGCMPELCMQLAIIMIGKQFKSMFFEAILPWIQRGCKKISRRLKVASKEQDTPTRSEMRVKDPQWIRDYELLEWENFSLTDEYLDMVLQFGFVTIFVAAFPLAPFFALINNIIEIRLDAKKMVTHYRRPVGYRAKGIGIWEDIVDGIVKIAVVSNALIIAITSNFIPKLMYRYFLTSANNENYGTLSGYLNYSLTAFSETDLQYKPLPTVAVRTGNPEVCYFQAYRFGYDAGPELKYKYKVGHWQIWLARVIFVLLYENFVYLVIMFVRWAIPDVPTKLRLKIQKEERLLNELILKHEQLRTRKNTLARHRRSKRATVTEEKSRLSAKSIKTEHMEIPSE